MTPALKATAIFLIPRPWRFALIVAAVVLVLGASARAQEFNLLIEHPDIVAHTGLGPEEWVAEWWQWVAAIPNPENPLLDERGDNCRIDQDREVFFLANTLQGSALRQCEVEAGKIIFFPILNTAQLTVDNVLPCPELCMEADELMMPHNILDLRASIDGIDIGDPMQHFITTPGCFEIALVEDNIFGIPVANDDLHQVCSSGYWVMVEGLGAGPHVIQFEGETIDGTSVDVTYNLLVLSDGPLFHRGDANGDGTNNIVDAVYILQNLFAGGPAIACRDAGDANNDHSIDISDALFLLINLFLGGTPIPPPGPPGLPCGPDPGFPQETLGCESYICN